MYRYMNIYTYYFYLPRIMPIKGDTSRKHPFNFHFNLKYKLDYSSLVLSFNQSAISSLFF